MEPLFDNKKFRNNYNIIKDCELLKIGTQYFFAHPKNRTIEYHFYHFGLLFDSNHYEKNKNWKETIYTPTRELFKDKVNIETLLSIQLGKDLSNKYDEKKADQFDPYYWRITKAIEYKRPNWAFYMFLGNIQGLFNGDRISQERFKKYLDLFPNRFLQENIDEIEFIFNYFDERGCTLSLKGEVKLLFKGNRLYKELNANI